MNCFVAIEFNARAAALAELQRSARLALAGRAIRAERAERQRRRNSIAINEGQPRNLEPLLPLNPILNATERQNEIGDINNQQADIDPDPNLLHSDDNRPNPDQIIQANIENAPVAIKSRRFSISIIPDKTPFFIRGRRPSRDNQIPSTSHEDDVEPSTSKVILI